MTWRLTLKNVQDTAASVDTVVTKQVISPGQRMRCDNDIVQPKDWIIFGRTLVWMRDSDLSDIWVTRIADI